MAGNTGRMTKEAVEARGPRIVLWSILALKNCHTQRVGFAITREDHMPVPYLHYAQNYARRYAMSYSLRYLLRLTQGAEDCKA